MSEENNVVLVKEEMIEMGDEILMTEIKEEIVTETEEEIVTKMEDEMMLKMEEEVVLKMEDEMVTKMGADVVQAPNSRGRRHEDDPVCGVGPDNQRTRAQANIMYGERGHVLLEIDGFKYKRHRELATGETRWRCYKTSCVASVKTTGASYVITETHSIHSHEPMSERDRQRKLLSGAAKRKAEEEISERPARILQSLLTEQNTETLQNSDLSRIKRNMYDVRRKSLPTLPKTTEDVFNAIRSSNLKTENGEDYVLVNDSDNGLVIFSCATNLKALTTSSAVYIDGSVQYCPKFFYQLLTIHGYFSGHYIPLVFCLLKGKVESTYELCFSVLVDICNEHSLVLQPLTVVTSLELGLRNACQATWPLCDLFCCRSHLRQCWWRKMQNLGLAKDCKADNDYGKWLKTFFGLVFLKPEDVEPCFDVIVAEQPRRTESLNLFTAYLRENYATRTSKYPPPSWASPSSESYLTSHACESSFHHQYNQKFSNPHPNIFTFTQFLLHYQKEILVKVNSAESRPATEDSHAQQQFVEQQLRKYLSGGLSSRDFVSLVSSHYSPYC